MLHIRMLLIINKLTKVMITCLMWLLIYINAVEEYSFEVG